MMERHWKYFVVFVAFKLLAVLWLFTGISIEHSEHMSFIFVFGGDIVALAFVVYALFRVIVWRPSPILEADSLFSRSVRFVLSVAGFGLVCLLALVNGIAGLAAWFVLFFLLRSATYDSRGRIKS
ncbi:hypothetical protein [Salidesulfovibrio onnuriiensis]|uniref:hypothetical protein n=1 Tax=Salidesulfovibrio onnuriiensis TaxID=2583823 RepID=UPI0011CA8874|nr:hypothetical protein [Salidesulfovibrio onnuriiensis]